MGVDRFARAVLWPAAVAAVSLVLAVAAAGAQRPPITQAQSGKTFRLVKGSTATLRLSGRWGWTQPRVSSRAVGLTPVMYFADPGFSEWVVSAHARGTATIRSLGTPGCAGCGLAVRSFRVTIVVG